MKKMTRWISLVLVLVTVVSMLTTGAVFAVENTGRGLASDVVAVATAQKHGTSGKTDTNWFWNDGKSHAWCASFVSWCADMAGASDSVPADGGCSGLYKKILKAGGNVVTAPEPGDIVFYHKNSAAKNTYCHVGIVTSVKGSKVYTSQGNVSNQVWQNLEVKQYRLNASKNPSSYAYSITYLRPAYAEKTAEKQTGSVVDAAQELVNKVLGACMAEGDYTIKNKASGRLLDIYGKANSSTHKSNVQVYKSNGAKSQIFHIEQTENGWFAVTPLSNTALRVNAYSNAPKAGCNVNVYKNTDDSTQGWYFEKVGEYYVIRCAYDTSLVLTCEGKKDLSNVKLAAYKEGNSYQLWSLNRAD